ncbi:MAG: helix-turn-helix transcriptional regulator [Betaproteobacteria bacterium]|nr:helix-turn-helix transcriptional regulator [Betaproteobacteria bacterium]
MLPKISGCKRTFMSDASSVVTTSAAILGAVLARLRKEKNLTQDELGKAAGVGATTWSRIEQGSSQLSTEQLRAAAKALGVSSAFVLGKAEELEEEFKAKGIVVGDVPPKDWAGASSGGMLDALRPYLGAVGIIAGPLLIPLAGAALAGLIAKYWPEDPSESETGSGASGVKKPSRSQK